MGKIFLDSIDCLRDKELFLDKTDAGFAICSGRYCLVNELTKQEVYDLLKQVSYSSIEISKMLAKGRKYRFRYRIKYGRNQIGKVHR